MLTEVEKKVAKLGGDLKNMFPDHDTMVVAYPKKSVRQGNINKEILEAGQSHIALSDGLDPYSAIAYCDLVAQGIMDAITGVNPNVKAVDRASKGKDRYEG